MPGGDRSSAHELPLVAYETVLCLKVQPREKEGTRRLIVKSKASRLLS
jgi:hypothetical protein